MMRLPTLLILAGTLCIQAEHHKFVLIGAGPGGMQLAYFLQRANTDVVVLEQANRPGVFFEKYPIHRKLVSINKIATGSDDMEFNLRHDWNSLLSDKDDPRGNLLFTNYTTDFFPDADRLVQYFRDYASTYELPIHYNTEVKKITRHKDSFTIKAFRGGKPLTYTATVVVVCVGIGNPAYPKNAAGIQLTMGYEDFDPSTVVEKFTGKRVLILGMGNSAFEVANNITGVTNLIEICGRNPVQFSWQTHYAGDVRAYNGLFLDTYQLKSQNYIAECTVSEATTFAKMPDGSIRHDLAFSGDRTRDFQAMRDGLFYTPSKKLAYFTAASEFDIVIRALGFQMSRDFFDKNTMPDMDKKRKYPELTPQWESVNIQNMFFAGTTMAGRDARRSSVFAIHGFRYAAEALSKFLLARYEGIPRPKGRLANQAADLASSVIERVQYSSALYQMYGSMCEVYWFQKGKRGGKPFWYHERSIPCDYVFSAREFKKRNFFVVTLEYHPEFGKTKEKFNVYGDERVHFQLHPDEGHHSNFLHPVVRYFSPFNYDGTLNKYSNYVKLDNAHSADVDTSWTGEFSASPAVATHHIMESVLIDFGHLEAHIEPLVRWLTGLLYTRPELLPHPSQAPMFNVKPREHESFQPQGWLDKMFNKHQPKDLEYALDYLGSIHKGEEQWDPDSEWNLANIHSAKTEAQREQREELQDIRNTLTESLDKMGYDASDFSLESAGYLVDLNINDLSPEEAQAKLDEVMRQTGLKRKQKTLSSQSDSDSDPEEEEVISFDDDLEDTMEESAYPTHEEDIDTKIPGNIASAADAAVEAATSIREGGKPGTTRKPKGKKKRHFYEGELSQEEMEELEGTVRRGEMQDLFEEGKCLYVFQKITELSAKELSGLSPTEALKMKEKLAVAVRHLLYIQNMAISTAGPKDKAALDQGLEQTKEKALMIADTLDAIIARNSGRTEL